jgi:lipopolysaccharide export LptBFGC system permease protein LptF
MKATGISLYRVVAPILVLAAILAAALFAFDESYLPDANRRQEAAPRRDQRTSPHRPSSSRPQMDLRPDRPRRRPRPHLLLPGLRPYQHVFANLTVFEFDPRTFTLQRRIFAKSVRWDPTVNQLGLRQRMAAHLRQRNRRLLPDLPRRHLPRDPRAARLLHQGRHPSAGDELRRAHNYIADLRQSGFDTIPLSVQLERKLAVPAITLVMAILAVPFALSMGKRGGLAGIATAIGVAISYWVVAGIFSSTGKHQHPPSPARRLVSRPPLRHRRLLPPPPHPHLRRESAFASVLSPAILSSAQNPILSLHLRVKASSTPEGARSGASTAPIPRTCSKCDFSGSKATGST